MTSALVVDWATRVGTTFTAFIDVRLKFQQSIVTRPIPGGATQVKFGERLPVGSRPASRARPDSGLFRDPSGARGRPRRGGRGVVAKGQDQAISRAHACGAGQPPCRFMAFRGVVGARPRAAVDTDQIVAVRVAGFAEIGRGKSEGQLFLIRRSCPAQGRRPSKWDSRASPWAIRSPLAGSGSNSIERLARPPGSRGNSRRSVVGPESGNGATPSVPGSRRTGAFVATRVVTSDGVRICTAFGMF